MELLGSMLDVAAVFSDDRYPVIDTLQLFKNTAVLPSARSDEMHPKSVQVLIEIEEPLAHLAF